MGRFVGYVPCERCRSKGRDSRGDNLATYEDGSAHCFACGYHRHPRLYRPRSTVLKEQHGAESKSALPADFTREIPAAGWKWLLQYGLSYSYWRPYCGYSPSTNRLVITHGSPVEVSVGRLLPPAKDEAGVVRLSGDNVGKVPVRVERKWRMWGDRLRHASFLEHTDTRATETVALVEDIVSAHKVSQVATTFPVFGVEIYPKLLMALRALKRPVALWLDEDQYALLPPKLNRMLTFLDVPVTFIRKRKDPKQYTVDEIKEILG